MQARQPQSMTSPNLRTVTPQMLIQQMVQEGDKPVQKSLNKRELDPETIAKREAMKDARAKREAAQDLRRYTIFVKNI